MKKHILNVVLLQLIGFSFNSIAQDKPGKALAFVLGSWEINTSKEKIVERWAKNQENNLNEKSYRISAKGDSLLTEILVIRNIVKDTFYCSTVLGQNESEEV